MDQNDSNVINIADVFERGYASYNAAKIAKQLAWKADIVILQFGENIPLATFNADVFKTGLKKLVSDLKESSNPQMFVVGYILGANAAIDEIKRGVCAEDPTHRVFVDMSGVGKDPENMGALAHPSDKGMALIAETLMNAILAHSATVAAAPLSVSPPAAGIRKDVGKFFAVDPSQIKVGGEIGRRIDLAIQKNLLAIEIENQFLNPFRQKQSRAMDYVGTGKLIDATVSFAYYSKDPKVIELKDRLVKELIATQLDDGYLGSFPDGARIVQLFDEHEMAYNIHALVNNYRYFRDQPSLDAARKLADYYVKNHKSAAATRDPKLVCKIDIERALIAMSEASGDVRYRDYIVEREDLRHWNSPIHVVGTGQLASSQNHAYTFMNLCLAQLDLYRGQPDDELLAQSHLVIDHLTRHDGLVISGTCSLKEQFNDNQETLGDVGESCATAYLIRMTHYLLQLEGKTLNGDIMERAIYNALFAAQSPDGRSLRYFTAIDGPRKYWDKDSYCCPGNWRRSVAELPEMIYYRTADGGVMVNLYTASTADVPVGSNLTVRLRQETDYPNSGKVVITVDPSRSAEFPLRLRIPRWCESASVSVNGKPVGGPAKPGEWCSFKRLWKTGDVVTLEMPMKTRLVRGRKLQAGKVAVMRGPLVFCFNPARQATRSPAAELTVDWTTLAGPVPDPSIRPDGLALEVRAWGPASDLKKPADQKLVLSEFVDPAGEQTYWPAADPKAGVADELCEVGPVNKGEVKMSREDKDQATLQSTHVEGRGGQAGVNPGEALPGWLNVKGFGAKGDLQAITDAETVKGSPILKSAAGRFKPTDVGKLCTVDKAISNTVSLYTVIVSWQSSNQVTLRDAAGISVTNAGAIWGTDDTQAIQAAIDEIDARGGGTIYFPPGTYYIHGAPGGAHGENAQLRLPSVGCPTGRIVPITFLGACRPVMAMLRGLADNNGGSMLFSDCESDGNASMIGARGPVSMNAAAGWPFLSNVFPHFENLAVSITDFRTIHNGAPFGPSITALNMFDVEAASTRNVVIQYRAPNYHTAGNPWCGKNPPTSYANASVQRNKWGELEISVAGIKFPQVLNNINNTAEGDLMAIGFPTGVVVSELFCGFRVQTAGCYTGLFIGPSSHSLVIQNVVSQWNHFGIAITETGILPKIMISSYSVEVNAPGQEVWEGTPDWTGNGDDYHDPKDAGRGLIYYCAYNKGFVNLRITNGGKPKITITRLDEE
ncbi:MAG: beta-L-arabinofuranosidase domain-containing protein [bacterium]